MPFILLFVGTGDRLCGAAALTPIGCRHYISSRTGSGKNSQRLHLNVVHEVNGTIEGMIFQRGSNSLLFHPEPTPVNRSSFYQLRERDSVRAFLSIP